MGSENSIRHGKIAVLGLITISSYGAWFYAFGVLLDPIVADTGWSEAALAAGFSASVLLGGLGSVPGGWLLDRFGSRVVFTLGGIASGAGFTVAALAESPVVFAVASAVAGGLLASLGFYHVTQTTAVRVTPRNPDRAIAVLTIWGAFSSAIYMPLAAFVVGAFGWRFTLGALAASAAVSLAIGGVFINTGAVRHIANRDIAGGLRVALGQRPARRFLVAEALAGIGVATLLVYQVPAMTSAGLPIAAASFWAGARGFSQLFGRLPLMSIVNRLGVVGSLRLAYLATATGALVLAFAGTPLIAAVYAAVAGFGIGATSPLVGMRSTQVFVGSSLGTGMGLVGMVFLVVGSIGPAAAGVISERTGSRVVPVLGAAVVVYLAALALGGDRQSTPLTSRGHDFGAQDTSSPRKPDPSSP